MDNNLSLLFTKLGAVKKIIDGFVSDPRSRYFDPQKVMGYLSSAHQMIDQLREQLPELYGEVPRRDIPTPTETSDNEGRGFIPRSAIESIARDLGYIFEIRVGTEQHPVVKETAMDRVFISHGRSPDWRELQAYLERDIGIATLELAQEANLGQFVLQKLISESNKCSYAVIVMTGDDRGADGIVRVRENVMYEIGFFHAKYGLERVALLHEEGANIPSNIEGLVRIMYPSGHIKATFAELARELKAVFKL